MDKYLEDIQTGVFEAKTKNPKKKPKKKTKDELDDIAGEIHAEIETLMIDGDDWQSEADRIMQNDYDLTDTEKEIIADMLESRANNLMDDEED